jgi:hypothetical protein
LRIRLHAGRRFDAAASTEETAMKFMMTFSWKADAKVREEAIARFRRTGGLPPEGAQLIGRWTRADLSGGFDLIESSDAKALAEFALGWSDLMDLMITPVLEDREFGEVLQHAVAR